MEDALVETEDGQLDEGDGKVVEGLRRECDLLVQLLAKRMHCKGLFACELTKTNVFGLSMNMI